MKRQASSSAGATGSRQTRGPTRTRIDTARMHYRQVSPRTTRVQNSFCHAECAAGGCTTSPLEPSSREPSSLEPSTLEPSILHRQICAILPACTKVRLSNIACARTAPAGTRATGRRRTRSGSRPRRRGSSSASTTAIG